MTNDWENDRNLRWLKSLVDGVENSNHAAEETAQKLYRFAWGSAPHMHVAGHLVGLPPGTCATCGKDLRDAIHARIVR